MKSKDIVLWVEDETEGDGWIEAWKGYGILLEEENAIREIEKIMNRFNTHLRPYESPRTVISFVLSDDYDEKDD